MTFRSRLAYAARLPWTLLRRTKLSHWIMVSMLVGILVGWLAPDFGKELKPISNVFLRMIKTLVVPLIFSTLVVGIAGHGDDLAMIGRLAVKSLVYFEVVTTLALVVGLVMVNLMRPGDGVNLAGGSAQAGQEFAKTEMGWEKELYAIVPESFADAAARNEVLQIVVCSIVFAIAIVRLSKPELKKVMIEWCESLSEIMFQVTDIVMNFAPIGIGCAMAYTIGSSGLSVLISLGKLIGCLYVSLLTFVVVVLLPILLLSRLPAMGFLRCVAQPVLIGFSTASSEAALPKAMENLVDYGVSRKVVAFVMPTGYSFNLDGTTLYLSLASVFVSQAAGIELPIGKQIVMLLTLMLTSKGVAGVPRASLVVLSAALGSWGLPLEAVSLIMGVDAIMDMGRTAVNLLGNCLATAVMGKWEGQFRTEGYGDARPDDDLEKCDDVDSSKAAYRSRIIIEDGGLS